MNLFKKSWYIIGLISTLLLISACKDEHAEIGQMAPTLAVITLDGKQITLQSFIGKPLLLTFWSQNCGMCIKELRHFAKLQKENGANLHILAINVDDQPEQLKKRLQQEDFPFIVGLDQMKITAERYNLIGTPTSYYVDRQGRILQKFEKIIPEPILSRLFKGDING